MLYEQLPLTKAALVARLKRYHRFQAPRHDLGNSPDLLLPGHVWEIDAIGYGKQTVLIVEGKFDENSDEPFLSWRVIPLHPFYNGASAGLDTLLFGQDQRPQFATLAALEGPVLVDRFAYGRCLMKISMEEQVKVEQARHNAEVRTETDDTKRRFRSLFLDIFDPSFKDTWRKLYEVLDAEEEAAA